MSWWYIEYVNDGMGMGYMLEAETEEDAERILRTKVVVDYIEKIRRVDEQQDEVNHPSHYCKGGIECIDVIKVATEGLEGMEAVCTANILKYIFRWKDKNGITDVKKCRWYCEKLISELENQEVNE